MPNAQTLILNKNVVSRKKLVGIANFIQRNSEARFLSRGTTILSTEQEIRDTKRAQVLIPLLTGIKDVATVLAQAKGGGVNSSELTLNEFIVDLANEKITEPIIYRPRDGETINADAIFDRQKASFQITGTVAKDQAYYSNILAQGKVGVDVAVGGATGGKLKAEIIESKLDNTGTTATLIKNNAIAFANQLRQARNRIKKHKDKFLQSAISNADIAIVINADAETLLQNDARYNMYADTPIERNGALDIDVSGRFDKSPVLVSKQLPAGIDFLVMVFGAATSLFALRSVLNADKVPGVQAYLTSMEFDEGTGVWLPHLITIGTNDTTANPVQDAIGFESYELDMNISKTTSGNKDNPSGLNDLLKTKVADDLNGDGTIGDNEIVNFDAKGWYSTTYTADKGQLSSIQKRELKKALSLKPNATDAQVQTALDADKDNRTT